MSEKASLEVRTESVGDAEYLFLFSQFSYNNKIYTYILRSHEKVQANLASIYKPKYKQSILIKY